MLTAFCWDFWEMNVYCIEQWWNSDTTSDRVFWQRFLEGQGWSNISPNVGSSISSSKPLISTEQSWSFQPEGRSSKVSKMLEQCDRRPTLAQVVPAKVFVCGAVKLGPQCSHSWWSRGPFVCGTRRGAVLLLGHVEGCRLPACVCVSICVCG